MIQGLFQTYVEHRPGSLFAGLRSDFATTAALFHVFETKADEKDAVSGL
jgi:hypothetical protein